MRQAIVVLLLAGLAAVAVAGCGGTSDRPSVPVTGKIAGGGGPLWCIVHVFPEGDAGRFDRRVARGFVESDRTFRVEVPSPGVYDIQIQYTVSAELGSNRFYVLFHTLAGVAVASPATDLGTVDLGGEPP